MKVDQFESVFRSADKVPYQLEPIRLARILAVSDLQGEAETEFIKKAKSFLRVLGEEPRWDSLQVKEGDGLQSFLGHVSEKQPKLIYTYRCLGSEAYRHTYTLGEYLDVLTQITPCPVLVVPHPKTARASSHALADLNVVMAMTGHLAGDSRLVNYALAFTEPGGTLFLSHVEDDATFERYLTAISKIPDIDTETARQEILHHLLKEARDFAESCRQVVQQEELQLSVEAVVTRGHRIEEYRRLVQDHKIDLLVMNTKDEDQLAMHGMAYPLAVELREIPLLLL